MGLGWGASLLLTPQTVGGARYDLSLGQELVLILTTVLAFDPDFAGLCLVPQYPSINSSIVLQTHLHQNWDQLFGVCVGECSYSAKAVLPEHSPNHSSK